MESEAFGIELRKDLFDSLVHQTNGVSRCADKAGNRVCGNGGTLVRLNLSFIPHIPFGTRYMGEGSSNAVDNSSHTHDARMPPRCSG